MSLQRASSSSKWRILHVPLRGQGEETRRLHLRRWETEARKSPDIGWKEMSRQARGTASLTPDLHTSTTWPWAALQSWRLAFSHRQQSC